jgi:hypothetical protein
MAVRAASRNSHCPFIVALPRRENLDPHVATRLVAEGVRAKWVRASVDRAESGRGNADAI